MMENVFKEVLEEIKSKTHSLDLFRLNVAAFFETHPTLRNGNPSPIHSVKSRMKSDSSISDKLTRKTQDGENITKENVFIQITDFCGVRVLYLLPEQFKQIHEAIQTQVNDREWVLHEPPKAYTWDPDAVAYFKELGIPSEIKESLYTSVHYLVRPRSDSHACCEIQVRTLWEEIWGEVDHAINYPKKCEVVSCVQQIRVLAKLVGTGIRLTDAIMLSYRQAKT